MHDREHAKRINGHITGIRFSGGILAACLLTGLVACSGGSPAAAPPPSPSQPPSSTVSKPKTTAPTCTPAASPDTVTAACPFLGDDEIMQAQTRSVTGGSKESDPVQTDVGKAYACDYGRGRTGSLYVATDSTSAAQFLARSKRDCAHVVPMPGIGEGAMHCETKDAGLQIVVAKHSHGRLRTATLFLGVTGPEGGYGTLAKLLADRL
ncbi:hypothetical protein [Amycolatopsis australiensis]|uniref:DUF3558 domain-containing protein n=1 Tax=Amycolatopsis australiensis TaxID=546364 RepID=A0A1K1S0J2_9PSEU|nr:hypothetical protein [Amycolatopsis australiensis]SFW77607.1 hypothetical protein SAMN04489730_4345 [Amycolatopsis australiensis]